MCYLLATQPSSIDPETSLNVEQNTGWKPMLLWPSGLSSDLPETILRAISLRLK
jgi:hypothetical protein